MFTYVAFFICTTRSQKRIMSIDTQRYTYQSSTCVQLALVRRVRCISPSGSFTSSRIFIILSFRATINSTSRSRLLHFQEKPARTLRTLTRTPRPTKTPRVRVCGPGLFLIVADRNVLGPGSLGNEDVGRTQWRPEQAGLSGIVSYHHVWCFEV